MSDRVAEAGSWAQEDVSNILMDRNIIQNPNEAIALGNSIGALARLYAGRAGLTAGSNGLLTLGVRYLNHGKWSFDLSTVY